MSARWMLQLVGGRSGRALLSCAIAGALLAAAAADARAAAMAGAEKQEYKLVARWGEQGTGPGQFGEPHGLCFDRDGNLLVTDNELNRVYRFTRDGKLLGELKAGDAGFKAPRDVLVDEAGNTYVSNGGTGAIMRFDRDGKLAATWGDDPKQPGKLATPHSLAIGREGRLYVADPVNGRVQVYDPSSKFLFQWGSRGTEPGQFIAPHGVATDSEGNVYVAEYEGGRCQKFTADGKHLLTFGAAPAGEQRIYHSVTRDRRGDLYFTLREVSKTGYRSIIAKYNTKGGFITSFAPPVEAGRRFTPNCAAVDDQGRVYVANKGRGAVGILVFAPAQ